MKMRNKIIAVVLLLLIGNTVTWVLLGKEKLYKKQYENVLRYTPYLTEHWSKNINVFIENSEANKKEFLPDYYGYIPNIVNNYGELDSIKNIADQHIIVINCVLYNPFFNSLISGYWWYGTDAVSDYQENYLWFFYDWILINSEKKIKNNLNEILYKTPVVFGNSIENIQNKLGKADSTIRKIMDVKEITLLKYDGLQITAYKNLSEFYHDYSFLNKVTKIAVTNPEYLKDFPFSIGSNVSKARDYLDSEYLIIHNDSTIVFEKKRDDFGGYEKDQLIVKYKNNIISEIDWLYGDQYNL